MEAGTSIHSTVSSMMNTRNTGTRHRPLRSCAVTILTIAHKAYTRAEHVHGPIGILSQKLATLFGPIVYVFFYQYLSTLSFIDRRFLTIEKITERVFPPSAYLFEKIDRLVEVSETAPDKFDEVADKCLRIICEVQLIKWAIARVNSVLHFLIITLTDWGIHIATEKEIMIDKNSHDSAYECASSADSESESLPVFVNGHESTAGDTCTVDSAEESEEMCKEIEEKGCKKVQPTYKEILEKGSKEGERDDAVKRPSKDIASRDLGADAGGTGEEKNAIAGRVRIEDPILELFATAWHMN